MDRVTSHDLLATCSRRRITRRQVNQIKHSFPFQLLPPELRSLIYEYAVDLTTVEKVMDRCFENVLAHSPLKGKGIPEISIRKHTPTIFLLNKQIFKEASYLLQKQHVSFHHGLLDISSFKQLMPESILRNIASLEISDAGHPMVEKKYLPTSWSGYMNLMIELGEVLASGHKLKQLTIDFKHDRLTEHMTICHEADFKCGFRDQMTVAVKRLGNLRRIQNVTIHGLNEKEAAVLKERMESKTLSFLNLPLAIRQKVYRYIGDSIDPSSCSQALKRSLAGWTDKSRLFPFPPRQCPSIVTICKQINHEVKPFLYQKPLNLIFPADDSLKEQDKIPSMLGFITKNILKKVSTINIEMGAWEWVYNIDDRFVKALIESKKLKKLHFTFKDAMKKDFLANQLHCYPDNKVAAQLKRFTAIRGLEEVVFEGDLPLVYTDALAKIMTSKQGTPLSQLPQLKAITGSGAIVDVMDWDDDTPAQE